MFAKYYKKEIAEYCAQNGLSANKVFQSPVSYSDTRVSVLHHTPCKVRKEIISIGGPPMPITLEIYPTNTSPKKNTKRRRRPTGEKSGGATFVGSPLKN
jgi:hypothetical protein